MSQLRSGQPTACTHRATDQLRPLYIGGVWRQSGSESVAPGPDATRRAVVAWREASDKVSAMNESRKKRLTDYASCAG
jgi:hypothetical protein